MKHVAILAFDLALSSTITSIMDMFNMSGKTWNRLNHKPKENRFNVKLVSSNGKPITCVGDLTLSVHGSLEDLTDIDLLVIPTIAGNPEKTLALNQAALPWIKKHYENGADIASCSTGVYFLAQAGILDGKMATIHWGYAQDFSQSYPKVNLKPEQLITSDGNIFCAGGMAAWTDLYLFLMERYFGSEYVAETVKSAVMGSVREANASFGVSRGKKYHQDEEVLAIQNWMEEHFFTAINLEKLAQTFNMSTRTFKRRFKAATKESPLHYLQDLRVERAKKLLEMTNENINLIARQVGYEDVAFFSSLFKRLASVSPTAYRNKFQNK